MASPQTENGFTKFANELMEAFIRTRLPGQEIRVVLAVARKTYGYSKIRDQMSYGQIAKLTDIPRTRVIEHVKSLVSKKVLGSLNNGTRQPLTIWINKDYETWEPSPKKGTSPNHETIGSPNNETKPSPNKGTHKRKKESITKERAEEFEIFWKACAWGSEKGSKKNALKRWNETIKVRPPLKELLAIVSRQIEEKQQKKQRGEFTPQFKHVERWLKDQRWEDEIEKVDEPTSPAFQELRREDD